MIINWMSKQAASVTILAVFAVAADAVAAARLLVLLCLRRSSTSVSGYCTDMDPVNRRVSLCHGRRPRRPDCPALPPPWRSAIVLPAATLHPGKTRRFKDGSAHRRSANIRPDGKLWKGPSTRGMYGRQRGMDGRSAPCTA